MFLQHPQMSVQCQCHAALLTGEPIKKLNECNNLEYNDKQHENRQCPDEDHGLLNLRSTNTMLRHGHNMP